MHWIALQPEPDAPSGLGDGQGDHASGATTGALANANADTLADPLAALAWQALQFTPKVARVAQVAQVPLDEHAIGGNEALLMEISASETLFGGRAALLRQIYKTNQALGLWKYAQAATSLVALAKLQIGVRSRLPERGAPATNSVDRALTPICNFALDAPATSGETPASPLPLWTLAAARPHLSTLARIGCTTWGDLRALPRGGVARRFGAELLDALDRAYGLKPEIYPWLTLPEVFEAKIELHAQIETAPALMFGAQRLFKQLQLWLRLRNEGVAALEFGWTMDARRNTAREGALTLRTAQATQDIAHLQRLLGENLARLTLPAPALYLSLRTLETEALAGVSASLLLEDTQKGDALHQMVERLTARLGQENVVQLQTRADHRPEIRQKWIFMDNLLKYNAFKLPNTVAAHANYSRLKANNNSINLVKNRLLNPSSARSPTTPQRPDTLHPDALYPTWLLEPPLPLAVLHGTPHYQGPLALVAGPQRLETGWFDTPALRDYFIAQSEQAGLVWVFKERLGAKTEAGSGSEAWYLHGRFD